MIEALAIGGDNHSLASSQTVIFDDVLGAPNSSRAASTSAALVHTAARAVGTPAAAITSLANAFDPSSWAALALGP